MSDRYPQLEVTSREQLREWLAAQHAAVPGVWLVTFKKATGDRYVPYEAIVEEALCFGWVDSKSRGLDAERSQLLLTPRRTGSGWSRPNKERIARLRAAGRMTAAGDAVVDAAVADGSWSALDAVEDGIEPDDLRATLDALPGAREHFDAFPRSAKRAILEWISHAKRPETRARRIRDTAEQAALGKRANEWKRP